MSTLGSMRETVADVASTATSIPGFPYAPGRFVVPSVIVMPGAPYLETGMQYGAFTARFSVELVMGTAANQVTSSGLDDQIENAINGFLDSGFLIESVSSPYAIEANGQQYLAATIIVTNQLRP